MFCDLLGGHRIFEILLIRQHQEYGLLEFLRQPVTTSWMISLKSSPLHVVSFLVSVLSIT